MIAEPMQTNLDAHHLAAEIKRRARDLGFDLVGITDAGPSRYREYLRQWLDDGNAATMEYLKRRFEERTDPSVYLPGARSVICVAMNYRVDVQETPAQHGKIAKYALGDDYHEVLKPRLHQLADWLRSVEPTCQCKCAVDTAPVMEKEFAARAGIGWFGKNSCIINEGIGSWLFLGEIITTLALPPDAPAIDRCGTCTRCIDACPTQAITAPYEFDARRCISYLTIEHRTEIAPDLQSGVGDWLYGCDICQDVCPWNGRAPITELAAFQPRFPTASLESDEVLAWDEPHYRQRLRGSAIKRMKLPILQRNARIVATNLSRTGQEEKG